MRKTYLLLVLLAIFAFTVVANAEWVKGKNVNWNYDSIFNDADVSMGHGIAVDKYDRIWSGSYGAVPIHVWNADGTEASFSPINSVTVGDTTIDLTAGGCRGINLDHEGNILYGKNSALIKLNVEDGTGMALWVHSGGSILKPAVDQDGYIYVGIVVGVNPVKVLDPATFDVSTEITLPRAPGYARGMEVSPDGKTLIPSNLSGGPISIYYSEDYITYNKVDSIMLDKGENTIFPFQSTTMDWGPDGKLWISHAADYDATGNKDNGFVVVDLDAKTFSYARIPLDSTEANGPRGIAFSSDGLTAYATSFNGNKIWKFTAGDKGTPSAWTYNSDVVYYKWAYDTLFADQLPGAHGIVVDKYDRIWFGPYYASPGIQVWNADGTEASFSPISSVTVGDTTIDLTVSLNCRGMNVDHEGNILFAKGSALIKLNVEDGTGMALWVGGGSLLKPAVDQDGYIYCGLVVGINPVKVLDPATFDVSTEITLPRAPSYARGMEVTPDGKTLIPSNLSGGPISIYYSDDYITYNKVDSINFDVDGDPIFKYQNTTVDWSPDGTLWISHTADYDVAGNIGNGFAAIDLDGKRFDYLTIPMDSTEANGPRGVAFSNDGNTAYACSFNSDKIWKFKRIGVSSIDFDDDVIANMPTDFRLHQNYPNPFNPVTTIAFDLKNANSVKLTIFDLLGREVKVLVNKQLIEGRYAYPFDASNLATGIYLYRLSVGDQHVTKKMTFMK
jgi:sugar lactone lactonase YvrE